MRFLSNMASRFSILKETWRFMMARKLWWILPIVILLIIFGALIIVSEGSAFAPLIYALF